MAEHHGSAYWASRAADLLRVVGAAQAQKGMHGTSVSYDREAAECERYLEAHGRRDSAAPEMLAALQSILNESTTDIAGISRDEALAILSTIAGTARDAIAAAEKAAAT